MTLAADLGRFLAGEPVRARVVGLAGRASRWVGSHPGTALLGAVTGLLLVGPVCSSWQSRGGACPSLLPCVITLVFLLPRLAWRDPWPVSSPVAVFATIYFGLSGYPDQLLPLLLGTTGPHSPPPLAED